MVPAGRSSTTSFRSSRRISTKGDTIIDGGNSYYVDDSCAARPSYASAGIHYVDAASAAASGGCERGYCLMVGGDDEAVGRLRPVLEALAPGVEARRARPAARATAPEEQGWLHCGPPGAGHFVKMVHNGIEYGLMQAYAEG